MDSPKINPWQILGTLGISIGFISSMAVVFWTWIIVLSELGLIYFLASAIFFPITLIFAVPMVWALQDGFPIILLCIWILMWVAPTTGILLAIAKRSNPPPHD
jgi:hypothetical protein